MPIRRSHIIGVGVAAVAVALFVVGSTGAFILNQAQLDDGTCGHNQQLGSDPTASASATPWFLLYGDGSRASTTSSSTAHRSARSTRSTSSQRLHHSTVPLSDGPHRLTGNEISPNSAGIVTPFNFSVDTVPPAAPSTPVLASFSDSGIKSDNTTMFPNPTVSGTTVPGLGVQLYDNGVPGVGGASGDAAGNWSARTINLADGLHPITALTFDSAGNRRPSSGTLPLRIDTTKPTGALTSPGAADTVSNTVNVTASASDAGGIWKVDFQVDGVLKLSDTTSPYSQLWDSTSVVNGSHTLAAVIFDVAGNSITSSVSVNVQNGVATAPGAPTLTAATAGNASVALAWTAPASNGGSAITSYTVTASPGGATCTTSGLSCTVSGLTNGITYSFTVTATNAVGTGPPSNALSAIPAAVPGAPTLTSATRGNSQRRLGLGRPRLERRLADQLVHRRRPAPAAPPAPPADLSCTVSGLTNGTTYSFTVTATNAVGTGPASNALTAVPATVPGAPTLTAATAGNGQVSLAWTAPASNGGSRDHLLHRDRQPRRRHLHHQRRSPARSAGSRTAPPTASPSPRRTPSAPGPPRTR